MKTSSPIRVLIVDDSATVRKILSDALRNAPGIEVVGTAPDPYVAREKILALNPDVLTLDIEMPRMDGLTFLKKLMDYKPMPVIMISSLGQASAAATMEAFRLGAVEVLAKPNGPYSVGDLANSLADKIRACAQANPRAFKPSAAVIAEVSAPPAPAPAIAQPVAQPISSFVPPLPSGALPGFASRRIIAIGSSTGGPQTVAKIVSQFPADMPPVLITQHMPAGFTTHFAERLNKSCAMEVREAKDGDDVHPGLILIAPGDFHMTLQHTSAGLKVRVAGGPQVCFSRPSVDVLFASVAQLVGGPALGVLLTGMGTDGARGMLQMRQTGSVTIAQDENTSIVYGMPKEAARIGAAAMTLPLEKIAGEILRQISQPFVRKAAAIGR
ncbi:chemotaxis response regulator protein-glutamate methylesterase [Terriglobus albidus]|uniref:Protein-glutamate methylesterase/protein-glutamine glutaminase n=1 Tax=Terriglobus albidus TaxID=1592106 RepID=A0A5B9EE38_9BACT|nr:chemotaxis response regulator protein-glutamate methylesterase [Terriglobus albidus]QEE28316.1 chemotaxis response regulator protein-glutamate methylesterase [Terriglobus albidus]